MPKSPAKHSLYAWSILGEHANHKMRTIGLPSVMRHSLSAIDQNLTSYRLQSGRRVTSRRTHERWDNRVTNSLAHNHMARLVSTGSHNLQATDVSLPADLRQVSQHLLLTRHVYHPREMQLTTFYRRSLGCGRTLMQDGFDAALDPQTSPAPRLCPESGVLYWLCRCSSYNASYSRSDCAYSVD